MEGDLAEHSVERLTRRLAGRGAPAAGSAAAVATAMAAALVVKVAERSGSHLGDATAIARRAHDWRLRALRLAEEDEAAVAAMLAGSPARAAVVVPEEIDGLAATVSAEADRLASGGNPRLRADAVTARVLAEAARAAVDAILADDQG